jgi:hypothetical protein
MRKGLQIERTVKAAQGKSLPTSRADVKAGLLLVERRKDSDTSDLSPLIVNLHPYSAPRSSLTHPFLRSGWHANLLHRTPCHLSCSLVLFAASQDVVRVSFSVACILCLAA